LEGTSIALSPKVIEETGHVGHMWDISTFDLASGSNFSALQCTRIASRQLDNELLCQCDAHSGAHCNCKNRGKF